MPDEDKPTLTPRGLESYTDRYRRAQGIDVKKARRRMTHERLVRAVLAGSILLGLVLIWLVRELEADRDELLTFLGESILFVGGIVGLAVIAGGLIILVRRVLQRR